MRGTTGKSFYEIDSLPGCSQIGVSHSVFMHETFRGRGFGKRELDKRIAEYQSLGYDYIMCTTVSDNDAEIACLEARSFKRIDEFRSSRTRHSIIIWGRRI